jgi:hypothetical protein
MRLLGAARWKSFSSNNMSSSSKKRFRSPSSPARKDSDEEVQAPTPTDADENNLTVPLLLQPASTLSFTKSFALRAQSDYQTSRVLSSDNMMVPLAPPSKTRVRVYLIRHGESEANIRPALLQEQSDHMIPLSEEGRRQAAQVGEFLKALKLEEKCRILVSPYKRARDTADIILQTSGSSMFHDLRENIFLGEQQFGLFEGLSIDQIKTLYPAENAHFEKSSAYGGRFFARMPLGEVVGILFLFVRNLTLAKVSL